jgi:hypothetical protein
MGGVEHLDPDKLSDAGKQALLRNENLARIDPNPQEWFQEQGFPNWLEPKDMDRTGNFLTFNPTAQYGEVTSLLVLALAVKMSKTPEGMKLLAGIINKYLDTVGDCITSMQKASASSSLTAMINQYACTSIYERFGLISPLNAQRTKLWIDHIWGQTLNIDYFQYIAQGITTLVQGSSYKSETKSGFGEFGPEASSGSSGAGLGAIAKILASAAT